MRFARHGFHPICALVAVAGLAAATPADAAPRADYKLTFGSRTPGRATALAYHIVYRNPDDPGGKPPAIRSLDLALPAGTRVVPSAVTPCSAPDAEVLLLGAQACPDSRVGHGTITVITGFGPPVDPFDGDMTIVATPTGIMEIVDEARTGRTIATERLTLHDGHLTAHPAAYPGGPPDGQSAVSRVDGRVAAPGYVFTPPRCPRDRVWRSRGTFGFADGSRAVVNSTTPCRPSSGR